MQDDEKIFRMMMRRHIENNEQCNKVSMRMVENNAEKSPMVLSSSRVCCVEYDARSALY
jgi:hypothetical protein